MWMTRFWDWTARTFAVIYLTSYAEVTSRNRKMLKQYVRSYLLPEEMKIRIYSFVISSSSPVPPRP